ncbi:cupin domain-containing protein [Merismopedia glauca]|uniref:Cupin domain-containing protein n=1 Tax=Merismopedia glauca CCAP 1448/3 TaxID=1296344 RepID=A0A2T1C1Z5_9CYAN|nr:cupin domain-containing protein [Merismopedia glauca]PSB02224.1 cupin domain-containing protein [Merismopedia glauca CCAP 1448/3]
MTVTLLSAQTPVIQLGDRLEYPTAGVLSKILLKDSACQYTLLCLASGTEIREHTATRNATVHVIEGTGTLILNGNHISLESGVFLFIPANAPHAVQAVSNLAFLLTLSATDSVLT